MDPRSLTDLQADDITDLLHALSRPTAPADRSALEGEIVRRYRPLVRGQAARYAHRGVDKEDLAAVGDFALLKAIRRFDPDRGASRPSRRRRSAARSRSTSATTGG